MATLLHERSRGFLERVRQTPDQLLMLEDKIRPAMDAAKQAAAIELLTWSFRLAPWSSLIGSAAAPILFPHTAVSLKINHWRATGCPGWTPWWRAGCASCQRSRRRDTRSPEAATSHRHKEVRFEARGGGKRNFRMQAPLRQL